ncbi:MAG: hypothetical protein ACAH59_06055 [Pseudobdellovibrionaceae bacterium]
MRNKKAMILILISLLGMTAEAQQSASSMSMSSGQKKTNPFHLTADLSFSSNLYKEDTPQAEQSMVLDLIPSVDLSERVSLGSRSIITQKSTQGEQRDTTLSNTQINLKIKGPDLTKNISTGTLVRGVAPTDEQDRKSTSYQGSAGLAGQLAFTKGMTSLKYTLLGQRNFHGYTVDAEESPNVRQTLTNDLALELQVTKNFLISTSGFYKQGWTYRDFSRQTFGYSAGIGYAVADTWSIGASVETEGQAFKPNGTDSNIKFYDENTSVIKASVTFTN